MATSVKSERIQLRTSADAKAQILEAAALTQQDASSFILDAATSRARSVLLEQNVLRLSANDFMQIVNAVENDNEPSPELIALFERTRNDPRFVGWSPDLKEQLPPKTEVAGYSPE